MINALGLLEVSGLTASIEAADAMLKAAQVRLISQAVTPPGMITLVIEGDLAACRAALDAGAAAASRLGVVIARKEIGRPDENTEWFVLDLKRSQAPYSGNKPVSEKTTSTDTSIEASNKPKKEAEAKKAEPESVTSTAKVVAEKAESKPKETEVKVEKTQPAPVTSMAEVVAEKAESKPKETEVKVEKTPLKPVPEKPDVKVKEADSKKAEETKETNDEVNEKKLLRFIAEKSQGRNATDMMDHFKITRAEVKVLLEHCISKGLLRKRGNRYYIIVEAKK